MSAEELKKKGNDAFTAGRFQEAIEHFSNALQVDPTNAVLYSNRSAAEASLCLYESALLDAKKATELRPDWSKGYSRQGTALLGLEEYEEAIEAFQKGLGYEPDNAALKQGLETALARSKSADGAGPTTSGPDAAGGAAPGFDNPFNDPATMQRLAKNPKTAPFLNQPDFMRILGELQKDPKALSRHLGDQRIMEALATILQIDDRNAPSATPTAAPKPAPATQPKPEARTAVPKMSSAEEEEALQEKEKGNAFYKQKDFANAIAHYDKAIQLDGTNASFLANKSAVFFEQDRFEECIKVCEEAVAVGREYHAEFKLIGRVLGRIGSCHERLGNLEEAIKYYNKSLTEAKNPEIHDKLKAAEKAKVAADKAKMYNPELAEAERNLGNEAFKKADYVAAVKHYTEAIRRDERDPRAYSNRSACYLKLAAIQEGLKDADKCLELDPGFVKGYLRKAALLSVKREWEQAMAVCEAGMEQDREGRSRHEFQQQIAKCYAQMSGSGGAGSESQEEKAQRALQNPEVQEILADPAMRLILKQMETDPAALMEHMKNPQVAAKIRKLIQHGVLRTGHR